MIIVTGAQNLASRVDTTNDKARINVCVRYGDFLTFMTKIFGNKYTDLGLAKSEKNQLFRIYVTLATRAKHTENRSNVSPSTYITLDIVCGKHMAFNSHANKCAAVAC